MIECGFYDEGDLNMSIPWVSVVMWGISGIMSLIMCARKDNCSWAVFWITWGCLMLYVVSDAIS